MALPSGTEGYWRFNESSGNASDESSNNFTLTNNSTATYAAGKIDNAMSTDGSSNFTNASVTRFGTDLFTIAFWIKTNQDALKVLISAGTGTSANGALTVWQNGTTGIKINDTYAGGTILQSDVDITDNAWHHVVLTRDGSDDMKCWIDGTEDVSARVNDTTNWNETGNFYVHDRAEDDTYIPTASMDNLLWIKGSAWGSSEVATDYNSGDGKDYTVTNITINPSALTLSLAQPTQSVVVNVSQALSLSSALNVTAPTIYTIEATGTVEVGSGGVGTRFINKKWPFTKGLVAGTTKDWERK